MHQTLAKAKSSKNIAKNLKEKLAWWSNKRLEETKCYLDVKKRL